MNIAIYQVNMDRDNDNVAFLNYENLERFQGSNMINSKIYDKVFEGEVDCGSLEEVYRMFNIDHPGGYRGRSLSVSDVVEVVSEGKSTFYFCNSIGFKEIDFAPDMAETLKEKKINVVLCEPGKQARTATIEASLERYQKIVGGYIEAYYPFEEPVCIVCNEEGKINGLPLNRAVYADPDCGEMLDIIAGTLSPEPSLFVTAAARISAVFLQNSSGAIRSCSSTRNGSSEPVMISRPCRISRREARSAEARGSLEENACGIFLASIVL